MNQKKIDRRKLIYGVRLAFTIIALFYGLYEANLWLAITAGTLFIADGMIIASYEAEDVAIEKKTLNSRQYKELDKKYMTVCAAYAVEVSGLGIEEYPPDLLKNLDEVLPDVRNLTSEEVSQLREMMRKRHDKAYWNSKGVETWVEPRPPHRTTPFGWVRYVS